MPVTELPQGVDVRLAQQPQPGFLPEGWAEGGLARFKVPEPIREIGLRDKTKLKGHGTAKSRC